MGQGLQRFVRRECADYDESQGACIHDKACSVLAGEPCAHFERAVLGPPDYPYRVPGYNYHKIFSEYGKINPAFAARGVSVRRCECGAILQPRQRVCEKCRDRKRRETYRESKRRSRNHRVSTVKENSPSNSAL